LIRYTMVNGTQTIQEVCECCGEITADLHISEITVKAPDDPRDIVIKDKDNNNLTLKTKERFLSDRTASFIKEGLMDEDDAVEFRAKKELKYGMRPDAMCSMSIDIVNGVTQSFCYKTDNAEFLKKYSSSFHASTEKESTELGTKVGVDRKGNIIRMKSEKRVDLVTRRVKLKANGDEEEVKYKGQFETPWFRELEDRTRTLYHKTMLDCKTAIKEFGEKEVESGKAMARFKTADDFKKYIEKNCR